MAQIFRVPCDECENSSVGQCTKCKRFFCGDHLHYMGTDADTGELRLLCPEDLEKSKTEHIVCKEPTNINYANLVPLYEAVCSYIKILVEDDHGREDAKHYVFEAAIELFCGAKVWNTINKLQ